MNRAVTAAVTPAASIAWHLPLLLQVSLLLQWLYPSALLLCPALSKLLLLSLQLLLVVVASASAARCPTVTCVLLCQLPSHLRHHHYSGPQMLVQIQPLPCKRRQMVAQFPLMLAASSVLLMLV